MKLRSRTSKEKEVTAVNSNSVQKRKKEKEKNTATKTKTKRSRSSSISSSEKNKNDTLPAIPPLPKPKGPNSLLNNLVEYNLLQPGTIVGFLLPTGYWNFGKISNTPPYGIINEESEACPGMFHSPGPWVNAVKQSRENVLREINKIENVSSIVSLVKKNLDYQNIEEETNTSHNTFMLYSQSIVECLDKLGLIQRNHIPESPDRAGCWDHVRAYAPSPSIHMGEGQEGGGGGEEEIQLPNFDNPETWPSLSEFKNVYRMTRAKMDWRKNVTEWIYSILLRYSLGIFSTEVLEYQTKLTDFFEKSLEFGTWIASHSQAINDMIKKQEHETDTTCSFCENGNHHMNATQYICSKLPEFLQEISNNSKKSSSSEQGGGLTETDPLFAFFSQTLLMHFTKDDAAQRTETYRILAKNKQRFENLQARMQAETKNPKKQKGKRRKRTLSTSSPATLSRNDSNEKRNKKEEDGEEEEKKETSSVVYSFSMEDPSSLFPQIQEEKEEEQYSTEVSDPALFQPCVNVSPPEFLPMFSSQQRDQNIIFQNPPSPQTCTTMNHCFPEENGHENTGSLDPASYSLMFSNTTTTTPMDESILFACENTGDSFFDMLYEEQRQEEKRKERDNTLQEVNLSDSECLAQFELSESTVETLFASLSPVEMEDKTKQIEKKEPVRKQIPKFVWFPEKSYNITDTTTPVSMRNLLSFSIPISIQGLISSK